MSQFTSVVDKRSRQKMVDFLSGHFRYDTMRAWNRCGSYAHNVKLHRLGLTSEQYDAASSLIHADDDHWQYRVRQIIEQFTERHHGYYTIRQNGRSSGYMVLYQSSYKQSPYKSRCRSCGQLNFALPLNVSEMSETHAELTKYMVAKGKHWVDSVVLEQPEVVAINLPEAEKLTIIRSLRAKDLKGVSLDNKCGRCGAEGERGRQPYSARELTVWAGRGLDQGVDWEDNDEWSMSALKRRVELIQDFDSTVQTMRDELIYTIENFEVVDEVVMVPQKVTVVKPRGGV